MPAAQKEKPRTQKLVLSGLYLWSHVSSAEVPLADTSLVHGQDQSLGKGVDAGDGIHWGYQYAVSHTFIPLYFGSLYFRFEVHIFIPCSRY